MELAPLAVLAVGLFVVLGAMLVLRLHAFLSLLIAAIVVSLLSPGAIDLRVRRVVEAFGSTAGSIGIVIALAAIIGKCAMDSGAADRVVRTALRVFGEKRAPSALCSAGFLLAIPVFFDTVFYLLVPLAKSLYRQTRKHYVLYVTAISCGGAITHTLVPPTPGPLFMAERFGIDLGMMILVGVLIGIPTAVVGLMACHLLSRWTDVPMRGDDSAGSGDAATDVVPDEQLPPLWLAIAPVLLPVLLISLNTFAAALADGERAARVSPEQIRRPEVFFEATAAAAPAPSSADAWAAKVARHVGARLKNVLSADPANVSPETLADALNQLLGNRQLFVGEQWSALVYPPEAEPLRRKGLDRLTAAEVERLNRLVIESYLSEAIAPHQWETPRRKLARATAVLGDANLALLISALIALATLKKYRGLDLRQLTAASEEPLLSAGAIILITSAGGAFGAMLRESGLREAVAAAFGGQSAGLGVMAAAFAIAAMLKAAQGSSTVAIMTTTAMFAAAGVNSGDLGFHLVYLASSIAGGSLVGSWMNDSGFWIYARMSGLTEAETLRTWTILLATLGTTAWLVSMAAAAVLPLV